MTKNCVLPAAGSDNTNVNPNNIIFTIEDTKWLIPIGILSTRDDQKLLKLLCKRYENSVY